MHERQGPEEGERLAVPHPHRDGLRYVEEVNVLVGLAGGSPGGGGGVFLFFFFWGGGGGGAGGGGGGGGGGGELLVIRVDFKMY
jgi:hypothetical protein